MNDDTLKLYKLQIDKATGSITKDKVLIFQECLDIVLTSITEYNKNTSSQLIETTSDSTTNLDKTSIEAFNKEYNDCYSLVTKIVLERNLKVEGLTSAQLRKKLTDEIAGFSVIAPLIEDPKVSDIYIINHNLIFYRKNDTNNSFSERFRDLKHYNDFVEKITSRAGQMLDNGEHRIIDFQFCSFRFNVVNNKISQTGTTIAIRKKSSNNLTINTLVENGLMNYEMLELIQCIFKGKQSLAIAGGTGSGKTTTLTAFLQDVLSKLNRRLIICEDTSEIFISNPNTVSMLTYKSKDNPTTLRDAIISCLRMRPDAIVIGEIRGQEAEAAIEAAETGHPIYLTLHAKRSINAINRFVTKYMTQMPSLSSEIVERIVGNALDFIIIQAETTKGRKMIEICEVGFDDTHKQIMLTNIFEYDFIKDKFIFKNFVSKDKVQAMIAEGADYDLAVKFLNPDILNEIT